jgi:LPXTG-motif cell wall-anchored protein
MRLRHALATMAGATLLVGLPATAAVAQDYPGGTTPSSVLSQSQDRPDEVLGTTASRPAAAPAQQTLPVTGGDLAGLAVVGVSLVGLGTVVVRKSRRTAAAA